MKKTLLSILLTISACLSLQTNDSNAETCVANTDTFICGNLEVFEAFSTAVLDDYRLGIVFIGLEVCFPLMKGTEVYRKETVSCRVGDYLLPCLVLAASGEQAQKEEWVNCVGLAHHFDCGGI